MGYILSGAFGGLSVFHHSKIFTDYWYSLSYLVDMFLFSAFMCSVFCSYAMYFASTGPYLGLLFFLFSVVIMFTVYEK